MPDPRENCPWKCKHCFCYGREIQRLASENNVLQQIVDDYLDAYDKDCLISPAGVAKEMRLRLKLAPPEQKTLPEPPDGMERDL